MPKSRRKKTFRLRGLEQIVGQGLLVNTTLSEMLTAFDAIYVGLFAQTK